MTYRMTKTERIARDTLFAHMNRFDDGWLEREVQRKVPEEWHIIEADLDVEEPKEKVTLYLDRSTARAFKAMGKGYQARINRLLGTWLHMRAAGLLQTQEMIARRRSRMLKREFAVKAEGGETPGFGG